MKQRDQELTQVIQEVPFYRDLRFLISRFWILDIQEEEESMERERDRETCE